MAPPSVLRIFIFFFNIVLAISDDDEPCRNLPTSSQVVGHYAGFAVVHSDDFQNVFGPGFLPANLIEARTTVFKIPHRFWENYVVHFELTNSSGERVDFLTRGLRPANSRSIFVRGSTPSLHAILPSNITVDHSTSSRRGIFSPVLELLFGSPTNQSGYESDSIFSDFLDDSQDDFELILKASEDPYSHQDPTCIASGSIQRVSFAIDSPKEGPPVETYSDYFERPPDLIGQLDLTNDCKSKATSLSFALRKYDMSYFRGQHTRVGVLIAVKTLIETLLFIRELKRVSEQRSLLRTSWLMVYICVVYDAFEATFLFGRQNLGKEVSLPSSLSLVGLLKCLLIAGVQLRWIVHFWREKYQRDQGSSLDASNPLRWLGYLNSCIRWSAGFLILALWLMTKLFETAPEIVITLGSIYFVPQIIENIWRGSRHPLSGKFIGGTLLCRFVMPFLIWSSSAIYIIIGPGQVKPNTFSMSNAPLWFHALAPIPKGFKDSIFGSVPRRPNTLMLAWVALLMIWQSCHLVIQNVLSPRAGFPEWFCDKFLPRVFDYRLDVPKVAAVKQTIDPEITGIDCVICMTLVKFVDTDCVVSPCEHFFHRGCLSKWIDVKSECPTCRRPLPPI